MLNKKKNNSGFMIFLSLGIIFVLAFFCLHVRIQTTLVGYELGQLKKQESLLLEKRSHLQMKLAKITSRANLAIMASTTSAPKATASLAARN